MRLTARRVEAFRNLTQWEPVRAEEGRDNLVTQSALGDPRLVGLERIRELSGFNFTVEWGAGCLPPWRRHCCRSG